MTVMNMFAGLTPLIHGLEVVGAVSIPAVAAALSKRDCRPMKRFDLALANLARHRLLSVTLVFALCIALRLAMLPWLGIPIPAVHDEFSHLLAGDTFASGRPTNVTHPLWVHFESFHIIHQPTYQSMYPIAQGLILAFGQKCFGQPWYGVLVSTAFMCASIAWMLYGWVPPRWALFGGVLAVVRIGLLTYWMNSYWGGAAAAIGGALLVGAIPRLWKKPTPRPAIIGAVGIAILANSRPWEGLCLTIASTAIFLVRQLHQQKPKLKGLLLPLFLPAACVLGLAACGMTYYFWRVTGNPLQMPYQVNRGMYAVVPYFYGQSLKPTPVYHHAVMREFYLNSEMKWFDFAAGIRHVPQNMEGKLLHVFQFYFLPLMLLPLTMSWRFPRDRGVRWAMYILGLSALGMSLELYNSPHYYAPATCLLFLMMMQGLRHWRAKQSRTGGIAIPWLLLILCLVTGALRFSALVKEENAERSSGSMGRRAQLVEQLKALPGDHLVLVHYSPDHPPFMEWVYNEANIDGSRIVFARDMGEKNNAELLRYFRNRRAWIIHADESPVNPIPLQVH